MKKKDLKIILSGLDNAGKTSMIVALKKMYGFEEDVKKLKPTIRVDYYRRDFLNLKLNFWDMGGQHNFREAYLRRPIYFENVNVLIYLIDIQDEMRFTESIDYLGKLLSTLEEVGYDKEIPIFICFSKADYDLVQNYLVDYLSRMKMIKDLIFTSYPTYKFEFYSTSIFNVYSIVKMISNGLRHHMEGYEDITQLLYDFGERNEVKQALLFDHTGLVIVDFFKAEGEGLELQNKIDNIISGHLEFFSQLEDQHLRITSTRGTDGQYMNCCYQFNLYNSDDTEEEEPTEVIQERTEGNPMYANYYLSMIVPLDISVPAENDIPNTITKVAEVLMRILQ
jgi:GTPase SAR1 family protein